MAHDHEVRRNASATVAGTSDEALHLAIKLAVDEGSASYFSISPRLRKHSGSGG